MLFGRQNYVVAFAAMLALVFASPAAARLLITIDKSAQRMTVALDDLPVLEWPVSTGLRRYDTPTGDFKPFRMERHHFSREWDDAPMPHSIFFTKRGHAIHGTTHLKAIGQPASHGCVRLAPDNAATLFQLVRQEGMANTHVVLLGEVPDIAPGTAGTGSTRRSARNGDDDDGFTGALPPPRRSQQRRRGYRDGPSFFYDGRYYYDRYGRRYTGPIYRQRPRYYYERGGGPFWWGYR
jgi:hypothetical protein